MSSKTLITMKWNSTLITVVNFRRISFDSKNQIGVLDYNIDVVPLPKWKQIKTFYPDDPERRHSQSFAGFEIHLARKSNKYIQNYFIPSGIMVIMSWVNSSGKINSQMYLGTLTQCS